MQLEQIPPLDAEEEIERRIEHKASIFYTLPISRVEALVWRQAWREQQDKIQELKQALADETSTVDALANLLWSTSS